MPKNIVICCDGTGNEFENDCNSNVVKLYSTLVIDGVRQVGYYHPGVGTMGAPTAHNRLTKKWSVLVGLAFGAGLLANVGDAYRYLMSVYEDGDRVFLFGFSRGAYTARAIAGVLHMYGLLCPGNDGLIPYIIRLYAQKTRAAAGMEQTFNVAEEFKATFCRNCPLHFVGVWDTVSSVGWIWDPIRLPYTAQNPDMKIGRHAVSIDERRCYFRDNLWGPEIHDPQVDQNIKQVWFAGVHSDVGGSYLYSECGLSQLALEWMLCEAKPFGLLIDPQKADNVLARTLPSRQVPPNPAGLLHNSLTVGWWLLEFLPHKYFDKQTGKARWRIPLGARREIPSGSIVHESVVQRISLTLNPRYKPENLSADLLATCTTEPRKACNFE
jgi:uncharacterized protein (DUF2235 family)